MSPPPTPASPDPRRGGDGEASGVARAAVVRESDKSLDATYGETFKESLWAIAAQARQVVGAHQSAVSYVPDGDFTRAIHTQSFSEKYEKYNSYDVMPTGEGVWGAVVDRGLTQRMTDAELTAHPRWKNFSDLKDERGLEHPPMRGWLAVPVRRLNGDLIGALQLTDRFDGEFTEADEQTLSHFARVVGVSFDLYYYVNAELHQYERIVSSSSDLMALIDTHFVYLAANQAYLDAFGLTRKELVGRTVLELFDRAFFDTVIEPRAQQCFAGEPARFEGWVEFPVTGRQYMEVNLNPYRGPDDRILGFVVNARNTTAQHEIEEQLRQAQKLDAVGKLAGGVAHDFNNQLSGVLGFVELAIKDLDPTHPAVDDLHLAMRSGRKAAEMTHHLLAFSRKQVLRPQVVDMDELLASAEALLGRLIGEHIELVSMHGPGNRRIKVDPLQFEQAIVNLATNARDAMPNGGRLTFESREVDLDADYARRHPAVEPGPHVQLAVSDTGQGMDEDTRAEAFDPFFTTKRIGKGTGLGLSMVHGFVRQSGGHVWADSEPGKGTTFTLLFPRVEEVPERITREVARPAAARGTETILLVEDEEVVREVARRGLEAQGYRVLVAKDGEAALRLSEAHAAEIHLLLTDVVMPGIAGQHLAERLLATRPRTKVLYCSGYSENAIAHHGVLDPGTHFLPKPITPEILAHKVREVLDETAR